MSVSEVQWPTSWRTAPLWSMFRRVKDVEHPHEQMLSVYREHGVVLKESRDDNFNKTAENRNIYQLVDDGWLIVNRMKAWQGSLGISPLRGIVSGHYICFEPTHQEDSRFLNYLLRSRVYRVTLQQMSRGVRPSQIEIDNDELRALQIHLPPLTEQRAIADYLDAETARIDALIAKKQQLIHLLDERRSAFISAAVTIGLGSNQLVATGDDLVPYIPNGWRLMTMRRVLERIVDTPHKTAPVFDDESFLVVRTANVKGGRLAFAGARYTDIDTWREWNSRGHPRPGDVLFTREAPAGEACVVPADQPLCLGQRMVLLQVDRRRTTGEWLTHSIYSGAAQRFIEIYSNATTVAHLNMSDIPDIPVVVPPMDEQTRLLAAVQQADDRAHRGKQALERQIGLLAEHRQALITAAVTGELAVSDVR